MKDCRYSHILDASGLLCPMPVLRARRILETMNAGEHLQLITTDRASTEDIPAFCRLTGHALIHAWQDKEQFFFKIRCGGRAT